MSLATARQMVAAEILKLRHNRGTVAWALVLAVVVPGIYITYQGLSGNNGPGLPGFTRALNILGLFIGPLAAVLIGAEAGAGDHAAGVFRDLVVTGRSRLALFLVRLPGALVACLAVIGAGYAVVVAGTFAFAGTHATPSPALIVQAAGWVALANGVVCVLAVGLAAATASRPATITALVGWQIVASPLLLNARVLGGTRQALTDSALTYLKPGPPTGSLSVASSVPIALTVLALWALAFTTLGGWRTSRRDA
jgi:ABC-type transport system involved in multi-copper enzyme maturation permease subunit